MSVSDLLLTVSSYGLRKNQLNLEIAKLQTQKTWLLSSQEDIQNLKNADSNFIENKYKEIFNNDKDLQVEYSDYTELPDYIKEVNKMTAKFQCQLEDLTAYETILDNKITTNSTIIQEYSAYEEHFKSLLTNSIHDSFKLTLK